VREGMVLQGDRPEWSGVRCSQLVRARVTDRRALFPDQVVSDEHHRDDLLHRPAWHRGPGGTGGPRSGGRSWRIREETPAGQRSHCMEWVTWLGRPRFRIGCVQVRAIPQIGSLPGVQPMDARIFREPRHQLDQGRRAKLLSTAVTSFRINGKPDPHSANRPRPSMRPPRRSLTNEPPF
jgi:hypothetical protein